MLRRCYSFQVSHYTRNVIFEEVRAKLFQSIDIFFQADNELHVLEM